MGWGTKVCRGASSDAASRGVVMLLIEGYCVRFWINDSNRVVYVKRIYIYIYID